jgi:hypothetical protein
VVSLQPVSEPSSILMMGSAMIFLGWAPQKRNGRYNKRRFGFTGRTLAIKVVRHTLSSTATFKVTRHN